MCSVGSPGALRGFPRTRGLLALGHNGNGGRVYVTTAPSFKDASGCCIRVIDTRGIGIRDTPLWAGTKPPSRRGNVRLMGRRTDFVVMLGMAVAILIFAISIATHQWS